MKINIGEFIKNRRKAIGLTQGQLAEKIEVDERTLRRIENSEYKTSNSTAFSRILLKIADVLKLNETEIRALGVQSLNADMNHLDPSKLVLSSSISDLHYKLFEAQTYAKNSEYDKALEIYLAFEKLSDEPFYKIGWM